MFTQWIETEAIKPHSCVTSRTKSSFQIMYTVTQQHSRVNINCVHILWLLHHQMRIVLLLYKSFVCQRNTAVLANCTAAGIQLHPLTFYKFLRPRNAEKLLVLSSKLTLLFVFHVPLKVVHLCGISFCNKSHGIKQENNSLPRPKEHKLSY